MICMYAPTQTHTHKHTHIPGDALCRICFCSQDGSFCASPGCCSGNLLRCPDVMPIMRLDTWKVKFGRWRVDEML